MIVMNYYTIYPITHIYCTITTIFTCKHLTFPQILISNYLLQQSTTSFVLIYDRSFLTI